MIISPPFLPNLQAAEDVFLDAAMPNAPDGLYPVSASLQWHNGTHLQAPLENNQYLPVRAIADGDILYGVPPDAQPNPDPQHPQNYPAYPVSTTYPGEPVPAHRLQWTDKGLLILRHTTEIGASGSTPTTITYYSVYMHLKEFAPTLKPGAKVLRKDVLGRPGQIYGQHGRIHFEICCDEANLARLMGPQRSLQWERPDRAPTTDGRADAVFGSVYVYLPAGTPTQSAKPADALRSSAPATSALAEAQWVEIRCGGGNATLCSYRATEDVASRAVPGDPIGTPISEPGGEYGLFEEAGRRHTQALRQDPSLAPPNAPAQSSPSGWLELLRFGRNLGADPLPARAAHWRKIATAQGEVWADLNASGTFKFSDADFPAFRGWQCVADDTNPQDQRCDSVQLKLLLLTGLVGPDREATLKDREKLQARLNKPHIRERLAKLVCKFPTEWDQTSIAQRYGWHAELPGFKDNPQELERLMAHIRTLTCSPPQEYKDAVWHFQPSAFIAMFRKCGWLSEGEFTQLVPSHAVRSGQWKDAQGVRHPGMFWEKIASPQSNNQRGRADPGVIANHRLPLNRTMRKYGINTPLRQAGFFGNSVQESTWLSALQEGGGAGYWYAPWFGRGFLQLTHPGNYFAYWEWRGRTIDPALKQSLLSAAATEAKKQPAQRSLTALADPNFAGMTQETKDWRTAVSGPSGTADVEGFLAPSDSAGFYWAMLMIKHADSPHVLERVSVPTVDTAGTPGGPKTYYRSRTFWRVSAAVNLPSAINRIDYSGINGFDSRCSAYGVTVAVLSEMRFPGGHVTPLEYPEGYTQRRNV